jgi:hypothetical protein
MSAALLIVFAAAAGVAYPLRLSEWASLSLPRTYGSLIVLPVEAAELPRFDVVCADIANPSFCQQRLDLAVAGQFA